MSTTDPSDKNSKLSTIVLFYDYNKNVVRRAIVTNRRKSLPLEINNLDSTDDLEQKNYEKELNSKINWNHINTSVNNEKNNIVTEKDEDEKTYTEIEEHDNIDDFQTEIFPFEN